MDKEAMQAENNPLFVHTGVWHDDQSIYEPKDSFSNLHGHDVLV